MRTLATLLVLLGLGMFILGCSEAPTKPEPVEGGPPAPALGDTEAPEPAGDTEPAGDIEPAGDTEAPAETDAAAPAEMDAAAPAETDAAAPAETTEEKKEE
jgi:hypothetical protein